MRKSNINKLDETLQDLVAKFHFKSGLICPNCDCPDAIKYGKYNNIQRFRCCACGRTYTFKSNTFIAGTHNIEKWNKYIECFKSGLSVRKCAKLVGISIPTAFSWRHRILSALKIEKVTRFVGNVEVISKKIRKCEKGNKNITRPAWMRGELAVSTKYLNRLVIAIDMYGNRLSKVFPDYNLNFIDDYDDFFSIVKSSTTIVADEFNSYLGNLIAKKLQLNFVLDSNKLFYMHEKLQNTTYHCHEYLNRLIDWLSRFKGIASKNLESYIKWYEMIITKIEGNSRIIECMI